MELQARLVLFHKQATSARTRFLRIEENVVLPRALPDLSACVENGDVVCHPTVAINAIMKTLGLDCDGVALEADFKECIETPDGLVPVYLAHFTSIDPPEEEAQKIGGQFIAITEARDLAPAQLDVLRRVYTHVME